MFRVSYVFIPHYFFSPRPFELFIYSLHYFATVTINFPIAFSNFICFPKHILFVIILCKQMPLSGTSFKIVC